MSKGVAFETTAFLALITFPFLSLTPTQRCCSLSYISSLTCVLSESLPPRFSSARWNEYAISTVPPRGTQKATPSSKKRSRMYKMCAVIAPLAGKPQKMHIVSM